MNMLRRRKRTGPPPGGNLKTLKGKPPWDFIKSLEAMEPKRFMTTTIYLNLVFNTTV